MELPVVFVWFAQRPGDLDEPGLAQQFRETVRRPSMDEHDFVVGRCCGSFGISLRDALAMAERLSARSALTYTAAALPRSSRTR
ncbi:MAG TPA: hypothetical protein VGP26_12955 [Actinophytocola sp.]|nr:hypothetical protein [Actinophytocola sp.]